MSTNKIVILSLLVVMAGVLHYVESLLPIPMPVPGFKLGLANIITVYAVARFTLRETVLIVILRVILGSIMSGVFFGPGFFIALSGALAAAVSMYAVHKYLRVFSIVGVSIIGAVLHNIGQLGAAALYIHSAEIFYYLPYLTIFAVGTGMVIGIVTAQLINGLQKADY